MSTRVFRAAFVTAATVLAAFPGGIGTAGAATVTSGNGTCYDGSIQAADRASDSIPNATRVGQKMDLVIPVRNADAVSRGGVFTDVAVDAEGKNKSAPPTIWWQVDKGPWQLIRFTWTAPAVKGTDPQWQSPDLLLGTFGAHQTRSLVLSTSFSSGSTRGVYSGWEVFGAASCDGMEQGFGDFAVSYQIASVG